MAQIGNEALFTFFERPIDMSDDELFALALGAMRDGARVCLERHAQQKRRKVDDRIALDVAFEVQQFTTRAVDAIMKLKPVTSGGSWLSLGHRLTWTVGDLMLADRWTAAAKLLSQLAQEVEAIQHASQKPPKS